MDKANVDVRWSMRVALWRWSFV